MSEGSTLLARVAQFADASLAALAERHVAETKTVEELRASLALPLPTTGLRPTEVIEQLIEGADGGMVASTSARFFGWVMGGTIPSSLAADWLVSLWDQNAAIAATSPATAIIEEVAGEWLKQIFALPSTTSYAFTTGCQMAHATCLAAARNAVLERCNWDVERNGLHGAPRVRLLTGSNVHASVGRSVRLLGFGTASLEILPEGEDGTMEVSTLRDALAGGTGPTIVILQAGDLNIGAFDDFQKLIPVAHAAGAWVHVDGAFGLWVRSSERRRHLAAGIEEADSIATDAHKWLNVPYDSGIAFVRDPQPHRAAMQVKANYIAPRDGMRDAIDWGPEWSRRARAIPLYAALRELGTCGVGDIVDRTCDIASELAQRIAELDGVRLERRPQLNQALLYFEDEREGASETDHDARTEKVIALVNESGLAFFTGTRYRGRSAMRLSASNWRLSQSDVQIVVAAVGEAIKRARAA